MLSIHETILTEVLQVFKPGPGESESECYKAASHLAKDLGAVPTSIRRFQDTLVRASDALSNCTILTTMSTQKQSSIPHATSPTSDSTSSKNADSGFSSEISSNPKSAPGQNGVAEPSSAEGSKKRKVSTGGSVMQDERQSTEIPKPTVTAAKPAPKVEYQDVSGEVEARLAAKQRKKKEKETSKKRKRPSLDSNADGQEINGIKVITEHPKQKKMRVVEAMKMPPANPKPSARRSARPAAAARSRAGTNGVSQTPTEPPASVVEQKSKEPVDELKGVKGGRRNRKHRRSGDGDQLEPHITITDTPSKKIKLGG